MSNFDLEHVKVILEALATFLQSEPELKSSSS